ncbi:pentapeptide repeat-containing protein [Paenibacillus sp. XY044]|uniref:pentapeptide repeat-containing protein n=1 Tax=Paenibacillus sp. XY044 TaxID=2026089 RepID=UPI00211B63B1|nr:pentapeptide repeat-containing protein [Paenibacillus sp. XY044]
MVPTPHHSEDSGDYGRDTLKADCAKCFGLCCVSLPFAASSDFAMDKQAGQPCRHLQSDFRCGIHDSLREKGFRGCTVYDCFGAGQKVSQVTYSGTDWRQAPETAKQMFEVFPVMRQLHELLAYLTQALSYEDAHLIHEELREQLSATQQLTELPPEKILELDIPVHRAEVNILLLKTSELVREEARRRYKGTAPRKNLKGRGADLIGAKLKGADLKFQSFRGAYLIAADLRDADLRITDLIGADFRDADIRGADLSRSLFLTQFQINAAKGNAATKIPPALERPFHWA